MTQSNGPAIDPEPEWWKKSHVHHKAIDAILPAPSWKEWYVCGNLEAVDAVICDTPISRSQETLGSVVYRGHLVGDPDGVALYELRARQTANPRVTRVTFSAPQSVNILDSLDVVVGAEIESEFAKIDCRGDYFLKLSKEYFALEDDLSRVSPAHSAWISYHVRVRMLKYYLEDIEERLTREFGITEKSKIRDSAKAPEQSSPSNRETQPADSRDPNREQSKSDHSYRPDYLDEEILKAYNKLREAAQKTTDEAIAQLIPKNHTRGGEPYTREWVNRRRNRLRSRLKWDV